MESPMSLEPTRDDLSIKKTRDGYSSGSSSREEEEAYSDPTRDLDSEDFRQRLNDFRKYLKSCTWRSPCKISLWHGFDTSDGPELFMEEKRMHKQAILARHLTKVNQRRLADEYDPCKAAYAYEEQQSGGRKGCSGRKGGGDAKKKRSVREMLVLEKQNRVAKLSNVKLIQQDAVGTLETHVNGFQFTSQDSTFRAHFLFKDIKASFFALADTVVPPFLHFHLGTVNEATKRKTKDMIFYLLMTSEQQKPEERNTDLNTFVYSVGKKWRSQVAFSSLRSFQKLDGMDRFSAIFQGRVSTLELTFSSMFLRVGEPSNDMFFVVNQPDIEIVCFSDPHEKGVAMIEMTVVCKDFKIESMLQIEIFDESLSDIKDWLNRGSVKYYVKNVENWKSLVKKIAEDFQTFLKCGGWEKYELEDENTKEAYYSMKSESDSSDSSNESDSEEE